MHHTKATCKHGRPWYSACLDCANDMWDAPSPLSMIQEDIDRELGIMRPPRQSNWYQFAATHPEAANRLTE